jgi:hypothetical protein
MDGILRAEEREFTGFVALLDILGFSSLVSGGTSSAQLQTYLEVVQGALNEGDGIGTVEYVVFSDSLVLTTEDDSEDALLTILE